MDWKNPTHPDIQDIESDPMKSLTIVADDRIGLLADISYILGKAKINIETINVTVVGGKAVITLTVKDYKKGMEVLRKNGFKITDEHSIIIKLPDKPGELSKITSELANEKININNVHMLSRDGKNTIVSLIVDKPKKAEKVLQEVLVKNEDIY